jgi:TRAP-type C4-dicarboxylate transport system permease small subunit
MSVFSQLAKLHDLVTHIGARIAAVFIAAISLLYCSEVVTRYFLHSPSSWTAAVAIYLMLGTVLLMMPYLVMVEDHISVTIGNYLPPRAAYILAVGVLFTCVLVCGISTYISAEETLRALRRGVKTTDTLFIPKWWLLAPIVYGLGSSTLHFCRHFLRLLSVKTAPRAEVSLA